MYLLFIGYFWVIDCIKIECIIMFQVRDLGGYLYIQERSIRQFVANSDFLTSNHESVRQTCQIYVVVGGLRFRTATKNASSQGHLPTGSSIVSVSPKIPMQKQYFYIFIN